MYSEVNQHKDKDNKQRIEKGQEAEGMYFSFPVTSHPVSFIFQLWKNWTETLPTSANCLYYFTL